MAVENITLNLIPTGDKPSIHVAQFDVDRAFTVTLKEGEDDFTPTDYTIELQVRKVDNNVVTVVPSETSGNVVTFNTTEQMTACSGTNLAELQLTKDCKTFATLHFYLVVQRDVLAGGVTSESAIHDLEEQIAVIVPQVIGDDYYTAEEVDEKIAEIPTFDPTNYYDKSEVDEKIAEIPTFDPTNYYDKSEVDEKIAEIPTFDPTNYYDKSETDTLLSDKADTSSLSTVATTGNYDDLLNKPTIPIIETTTIENTVIATFTDGADNVPVKSLVSEIVAVQSSGTPSPSNPLPIQTFTQANVTLAEKYIRATPTTPQTYSQNGIDVTTYANGRIEINGTATSSVAINIDIIGFTAFDDNTRKINFNNDFASSNAYVYFRNGSTNVDSWSMTSLYRTYTNYGTLANKYVDRIAIVIASGTTISNGSMMIEFIVMDTATTHTINFGQTVGKGTLNVTTGELTITHGVVDMGSFTWEKITTERMITLETISGAKLPITTETFNGACSWYKPASNEDVYYHTVSNSIAIQPTGLVVVYDTNYNSYADGNAYKTAVTGQKLVFELETPTVVQLTPTEVTTLLGENNIYANTGDINKLVYFKTGCESIATLIEAYM